jgi:hypothetical protein
MIAAVVGVVGMLGGGVAAYSGTSQAAEDCGALDTALNNNQNFIAGQQANPDANSQARIANRQAVIDLIQQRRAAAGCNGDGGEQPAAGNQNNNQGQSQGSGESCAGLDKALQNNQNFIAGQQANPDANSAGRIANRQAVIDLIQQRRAAAGCNGEVEAPAQENNNDNNNAEDSNSNENDADNNNNAEENNAEENNADDNNNDNANNNENAGAGEQVCNGSTVTVSGEGGAPGASSNQFPLGTQLSVTNLDNNKSTTVEVTSVSGSCILLNNAAFEEVRETGKFVIRRAVIRRVG